MKKITISDHRKVVKDVASMQFLSSGVLWRAAGIVR
jgi:hypothetical protein